jgi:carboxypeptidase family protein
VALLAACQPTTSAAISPTAVPMRMLAVVVSAPAGAPVPGANVCALSVAGREEGCGETSGSGTARLSLRPGTYAVHVTARPEMRFGPGRVWADVVEADATVVVNMVPRSIVAGTVRDEDGKTVASAEVCAHPPRDEPSTCTASRADGTYSVELAADVYKLDVRGPPGGKLIPQWARGRLSSEDADVVDARAGDATGIDVVLIKGVLLTGFVRGPSGVIEDAQVCTRTLAAPLPWDCERTKKNGSYLALREPGRYYVWVVPPDNVRLVAQWYDHALVGVGSSPFTLDADRSLDVTLEPGPQLHGRVTATDGEPIAQALVCVDTRFPTGRICRPTGSDGAYSVTTRPEDYVVQVVPPRAMDLIPEYWSGKRTWVDADRVTLGGGDRVLDLTLRRGARVTGVIRNVRGVPLEAATVNILDDAGPLLGAATDVSGTYSLVVPPGPYRIEVFAPFRGERGDYLSQEPREIVVSGFTRYDIVLEDL